MKLLKRVCRHRTMMAWKQSRIEYEQQLGQGYRNAMVKLEAEAAAMKVGVRVHWLHVHTGAIDVMAYFAGLVWLYST